MLARFGPDMAEAARTSKIRSAAELIGEVIQYTTGIKTPSMKTDRLTMVTGDYFNLVDEAPKYALYKSLWRTEGPGEAAYSGNFQLGKYGKGTWDDFRNAPEPWRKAEIKRYNESSWLSPFDIREKVGDLLTDYTKAADALRIMRGVVNPFSFFLFKVTKGLAKYWAKNPLRARAQQTVGSLTYAMQFDTPEEQAILNGINADAIPYQLDTPIGLMNTQYLTGMLNPTRHLNPNEWYLAQAAQEITSVLMRDRGAMMGDRKSIDLATLRAADRLSKFWFGSMQFSPFNIAARRKAIGGLSGYDENFMNPFRIKEGGVGLAEKPPTAMRAGGGTWQQLSGLMWKHPVRATERGLQVFEPQLSDVTSRFFVGLARTKVEPFTAASRQLRQSKTAQQTARQAQRSGESPIGRLANWFVMARKLGISEDQVKRVGPIEAIRGSAPDFAQDLPISMTSETLQQRVRVRDAMETALELANINGEVDAFTRRELAQSGLHELMRYLPAVTLANPKLREWIFSEDDKKKSRMMRDVARAGMIEFGLEKPTGAAMTEYYSDVMSPDELRDIPRDKRKSIGEWFERWLEILSVEQP